MLGKTTVKKQRHQRTKSDNVQVPQTDVPLEPAKQPIHPPVKRFGAFHNPNGMTINCKRAFGRDDLNMYKTKHVIAFSPSSKCVDCRNPLSCGRTYVGQTGRCTYENSRNLSTRCALSLRAVWRLTVAYVGALPHGNILPSLKD